VSCIRDRTLVHLIPCQRWVNRLSDYLFVLARNVEQRR
jgi:cob(I)alamin adenosyltransferase